MMFALWTDLFSVWTGKKEWDTHSYETGDSFEQSKTHIDETNTTCCCFCLNKKNEKRPYDDMQSNIIHIQINMS